MHNNRCKNAFEVEVCELLKKSIFSIVDAIRAQV